jgi:hypothetical protein
MQISAPNDGQVFWNPQSLIERSTHRSYGEWIVKAEDPIGSGLPGQELAHGFHTVLPTIHIYFGWGNDVIIKNS